MSAAYGIASFVDGLVKGRDVKHAWEDRKLDRERQKRMDELAMSQDARAAEEHRARMGVYDRQASDWQRQRDQQAAWEEANAAAVAATNEAMAAGAAQSQSGSAPQAEVAPQLVLPLAPPAPNNFAATAERLGGIAPQQGLGAVARPGPTVAAAGGQTPGPGFESVGRQAVAPQQAPAPAPRVTFEQWRAMDRGQRMAAGLPVSEIGGQLHFNRFGVGAGWNEPVYGDPVVDPLGIMPNYDHNWGQSLAGDAAEAGRRGLAGIGAAEGAVADIARRGVQGAANAVNSVVNPVAGYVSGGTAPELGMFTGNGWESKSPSQIREDQSKKTMELGLSKLSGMWQEATKPPAPNVPASAPPQTKALAATATDAMAATATPAMQAATEAAQSDPKSPVVKGMGLDPGKKVTEAQRSRAAGAFMDYYREYGAPIVMEDMLRRGDFAGAQAFQEFLDRGETKAAMESWAKAAFAANIGDMDTFASEIMTAYNRLDYFPDGTTIVEKDSGFTRGRDGEITGAKITFRDEKTGNTFEQVFSDPADLVRLGITMLAPEEAFKHYAGQVAADTETKTKAATESASARKDMEKRIDSAAKVILEASKGLDGVPTKTYAEARGEAEAAMGGLGALPGSGSGLPPPILRRP